MGVRVCSWIHLARVGYSVNKITNLDATAMEPVKGKYFPQVLHKCIRESVEVYAHSFLTLAIDGDKWQASSSSRFTNGKEFR